jgi:hypothetical protein
VSCDVMPTEREAPETGSERLLVTRSPMLTSGSGPG